MGICSSCESANVATAKLIHDDGRLQEFSYPVKVSYLLQRNPSYFICDSDEMDFDDVVYAVGEDEVLLPGQLYFSLPLSQLKRRLRAEEMAALAVKASSALSKSGDGSENILVYSGENGMKSSRKVADGGSARNGSGRRCDGGGGGRREKFTAKLGAIAE